MSTSVIFKSPVGNLLISGNGSAITRISFTNKKVVSIGTKNSELERAEKQLNEYFSGKRKSFDLSLSLDGTEFQKKVWNALMQIPYGETRSYKEVAEMIGSPKAHRAVGAAVKNNPIPIIIPCHRVIRSNGDIGEYSGGFDIKRKLLQLEGFEI
jgi:methylated-DNA-[protein]-cysteine S-methyltransferase